MYDYVLSILSGLVAEVSEKEACNLVRAFWEELEPFLDKNANIPSGDFIRLASRLAKTGHENRLSSHLPKFGLPTNIPLRYVDIGLKNAHPVLAVSDYIAAIDAMNKIDGLLMGNRAPQYKDFWSKWKSLQPSHPVFSKHSGHLGRCVPVAIHADEGTSVKKSSYGFTSSSSDGEGVPKTKS